MMNPSKVILVSICISLLAGCKLSEEKIDETNYQTFQISESILASIKPPSGFQITPEHYGFVQPESFSRIKIEEIELGRELYVEQLTKENFQHLKLLLLNKETIDISGSNCDLFTLRQEIAGIFYDKIWLIAGDALSSIKIEASYPQGASPKHKKAILDSIKSLSVQVNPAQRYYTGLPFKFKSLNGFKVSQRFTNSLIIEPIINDSNTTIIISHGVIENELEKISHLSDHFLEKNTKLSDTEIIKNEFINIDKIPAFSAQAYANFQGRSIWLNQITSTQKQKFLLIQAITDRENKTQLSNQFNELMQQFQFK